MRERERENFRNFHTVIKEKEEKQSLKSRKIHEICGTRENNFFY